MQRALKGQEQLAFVGAADDFSANPGNPQSITTMMQLACEAFSSAIRQRAADWLWQNVGVKVVDEGVESHAASSEAAGIR